LVTHDELSPGYQVAQTAHAIADFLLTQPAASQIWHANSNSLIVLSAQTAEELHHLYQKALSLGFNVTAFREPDILDEITGLAFTPSCHNKQFLSSLPLVGKQHNTAKSRENKLKSVAFKMMDENGFLPGEHALQTGRCLRELFSYQQISISSETDSLVTIERFLTLLYYGVTGNNGVFQKVASILDDEFLNLLWNSEELATWEKLLYEALDTVEQVKHSQISSDAEIELFTVICRKMLELS